MGLEGEGAREEEEEEEGMKEGNGWERKGEGKMKMME